MNILEIADHILRKRFKAEIAGVEIVRDIININHTSGALEKFKKNNCSQERNR
ncbi:hypothetical protein [Haladaptatus sp. R4]|uniref:hypothetical protein n=1 Tax=Haladaptatus sp. R4 TaxID=1679489 RepID=UPI0016806D0C|nr:hypothetical protein [Haladaptatus sp. R4]